jgi:phospholipase C
MKRLLMSASAAWLLAGLVPVWAQVAPATLITSAGQGGTAGAQAALDPGRETRLSLQQKIAMLRQHVKYVFVLFQENRSFDAYFGTYPGANGLFSTWPGAPEGDIYAASAEQLDRNGIGGFSSVIRETDGSYSILHPFLIPRTIRNAAGQTVQLYPEDTWSVDHSHNGYIADFHADAATRRQPKNDGYALDQEGLAYGSDASGPTAPVVSRATNAPPTANPNLQTKQKAEVVMAHFDCDTIPFLWQYADRFMLFDNFHQTETGPSTPNAIAVIAGQSGDTQWVKHPDQADPKGLTLPNLTDSAPFPGSSADTVKDKPPYGPDESTTPLDPTGAFPSIKPQVDLTFATLPLSFLGKAAPAVSKADESPGNLADVQQDLAAIAHDNPTVPWEWYQQGYGPEPFDGRPIAENGGGFHYANAPVHASYIVHHNGPQYFGYVGDNPAEQKHLHGLQQFTTDISKGALPATGGVFYVRGGYYNNDGLLPLDPNPTVQAATPGNDDHPNYSDAQISEALVADSVNAIAHSKYWAESAIVITYDESDGLYDHQPERFRTFGPDHQPETGGPRIPTIVISPFAAAHTVSHVYSEHSSLIRLIDELFRLTPLGKLPDEAQARADAAKNAAFDAPDGKPQTELGPADAVDGMGDMLEAFDNDRLTGKAKLLPPGYAEIDAAVVHKLPHPGCAALKITPTDYPTGYGEGKESDPPPQDFNPRPTQSPGVPYLNTNSNTGAPSTGAWPG